MQTSDQSLDYDAIENLLDWMVDGAQPYDNPRDIISEICERLVASRIPIGRFGLFIRTLHPNIRGRRFRWEPGKPIDFAQAFASTFTKEIYHNNPIPHITESRIPVRRRLLSPDCPDDYIIVGELREQGFTDYYAQPLRYLNGETNVGTWATKDSNGFTDEMLAVLDRVAKPLARLTETYLLYVNAANLLSTYVGRNVGAKILNGGIDRGSGEEIDAVILFADLKQFTKMSNLHSGSTLIAALNRSLDALIPPIEERDGEILKFLGDGFFAIFLYANEVEAKKAAKSAIAAIYEGVEKLEESNHQQTDELQFGIRTAVHAGTFHYGNIGGSDRMDFTAIGPPVNYTARLLSAATELEHDHVVSAEIARLLPDQCRKLGTAQFKGFDKTQTIYGTLPAKHN